MTELQWLSKMNIGIDVIDKQHRQIVDYINRLGEAIKASNKSEILQILDDVIDYTQSHFAFEEALMADAGYAALEVHQKIHTLFAQRVLRLKERYIDNEEIGGELQTMLCRWLSNHIQHDDAAYSSAVRQQILHLVEEKHEESWLGRSLKRFFGSTTH